MESEPAMKPVSSSEPGQENTAASKPSTIRPQRRTLMIAAAISGVALVAVTSFALGFSAGIHKARFSYRFGENYERNFVKTERQEMKEKILRKMDGKLFRSGHGVAGQIVSVADNLVVVSGPEGQENGVAVTAATIVMRGGDRISASDLKSGEKIVVLGKPNGDDGTIKADLIRVLDPAAGPSDGPIRKLFR